MQPENMLYYRGPRFQRTTSTESENADILHIQSLLTDITTSTGWGHTHLSHIPLRFCKMAPEVHTTTPSRTLLNLELALYACQAMRYDWAVYSFLNGHFSSSIESQLLCRTSQVARLLFSKNYSRRAHTGIYVGIQEILSSKSNTSSSINQSESLAAERRIKSTPTSSFESVYKQLLRRGAIGSIHRSPGTTRKLLFNKQRRIILREHNLNHRIQPRPPSTSPKKQQTEDQ